MFERFKKLFTKSISNYAQILDWGGARWIGDGYVSFAAHGYNKNVIAYHCVNRIATAVSSIPYNVEIDGKLVEKDPILQLLKRPNALQSYKEFMHTCILHRMIGGNTYIRGLKVYTGRIMEMQVLRPDRVTILANIYWEPYKYIYSLGQQVSYDIDPLTGLSEILHIKNTNPLNDLYGLSPMAAASMSIDQHNEAQTWNKALLQNMAKPPGIISIKDRSDNAPMLKPAQVEDIARKFNDRYVGGENAGKIPVFNYDMLWQSLGMTPTDMDWLNGKNSTARDICLAFNYPAQLLGQEEGSTFNNVDAAKMSFYEDTVIPLATHMLDELAWWLSQHSGREINIIPDIDDLPALAIRRDTMRATNRADVQAGILRINEARAAMDYPPAEGGDELLVPAGMLPLNYDANSMLSTEPTGLDEVDEDGNPIDPEEVDKISDDNPDEPEDDDYEDSDTGKPAPIKPNDF